MKYSFFLLLLAGYLPPTAAMGERQLSYAGDVRSVFQKRCDSCHAETDAVNFTTYKNAVKYKSQILGMVQSYEMPPVGMPMSSFDRVTIIRWIRQGANP